MDYTVAEFDSVGFFLWVHIKTNIYKTKIKDMDDLKIRITQEIEAIKKETLENAFSRNRKKLTFCISVKGGTLLSFKS